MTFTIRPETPSDHPAVEDLTREAFATIKEASGTEHELVAKLRKSPSFIPELSLVAEANGTLVGHILLTRMWIVDPSGKPHTSLALAPVSVLLAFQRQGIGGALIREGHKRAKALGHGSIILVGHAEYYPRFGYERASKWGLTAPFEVPDECFMAIELIPGALKGISGTIKYPPEFGIG